MHLIQDHNKTVFHKGFFTQVLLIHLVTLFIAPFVFTWQAAVFATVAMFLFGYPMGIFHHMYLTHHSFKASKTLERIGVLLGTLTWRGPFAGPIRYVAMHKIHHAYSDTELDPHTPTKGILFALITWFWNIPYGFSTYENYKGYAKELTEDRYLVFLDRNVDFLQFLWGVLSFTVGFFVGGLSMALSFLVYAVFVRAFFTLYLINAVDVINHTVGYRSYETKDHSTNSFLMFIVHLGGAISWHNNHHAHQHYFSVRKNWWEVDVHHNFLKALESSGLVSDIVVLDDYKREGMGIAK